MYKKNQVNEAIKKCLSNQEATIMKARLGIDQEPLTLKQLQKIYSVSIEELKRIESKIIIYLRNNK